MLTRTQVARRIRKSVATVRRMEGSLLWPVRNGRGVHLFNAAEVDKLAREIDARLVAVPHGLQDRNWTHVVYDQFSPEEESVRSLRVERDRLASEVRQLEFEVVQLRSRFSMLVVLLAAACVPHVRALAAKLAANGDPEYDLATPRLV